MSFLGYKKSGYLTKLVTRSQNRYSLLLLKILTGQADQSPMPTDVTRSQQIFISNKRLMGSGGGSVGRVSHPAPDIPSLNPNIGKYYHPRLHLNRSDKYKEKDAGNGPP